MKEAFFKMSKLRKFRPAIVNEIRGNKALITLNKKDMKSICAEKGCSVCNHDFPQTNMSIPIGEYDLKKGDSIVVSMVVLNEALGAFIAFILPLIVSVGFFYLVTTLMSWKQNEAKTVLGTLISLIISLFGLSAIDRVIRVIVPPRIEKKE